MGQGTSKSCGDGGDGGALELFSRFQLSQYFYGECIGRFRLVDIQTMRSKLNVTKLRRDDVITGGDVAHLLRLTGLEGQLLEGELLAETDKVDGAIKLLCESLRVVGRWPFLQDVGVEGCGLSVRELVIACFFHTELYKGMELFEFGVEDYTKLLFVSFSCFRGGSRGGSRAQEKREKPVLVLKSNTGANVNEKIEGGYVVEVLPLKNDSNVAENVSKRIKWNSFEVIKTWDGVDLNKLNIEAHNLWQVFTLLLAIYSVDETDLVCTSPQDLNKFIRDEWQIFEKYAMGLLRYIDVTITPENVSSKTIGLEQFRVEMNSGLMYFIRGVWRRLFSKGLLNSLNMNSTRNEEASGTKHLPTSGQKFEFKESKIMNHALLATISLGLATAKSSITATTRNTLKLYSGSESGFSIRSLELKVFKWQAPTILLVSGKRLRNKTIHLNKQYQKFNETYPKFFKSLDNPRREWQGENDIVSYAVIINQPWRNSNKNNFGDENTVIISLQPRFDVYKSTHSALLKGQLIYINTLGFGLGFGNSQPVNKKMFQSYVPGDVSLTIESNLEFAVFRHIGSMRSKSLLYFQNSLQQDLTNQDFEDRFMITDLEVWGVGSMKELLEQRKQLEWEEKQAEQRQSVNLKSLGEERAFLEMVGLVGNHNAAGGSV